MGFFKGTGVAGTLEYQAPPPPKPNVAILEWIYYTCPEVVYYLHVVR